MTTPTLHTLAQPLTFDTPAGPLETFACTCGRIFDALRWAAHLDREGER